MARSPSSRGCRDHRAVSAGGEPARESALGAGANVFLDKPMRLRRVIETMQRLIPV
jgi:hypothetical protein